MNLTVKIPEDLAQRPSTARDDLSRRALQSLAAEEYCQGRLHKPDLKRLLGFTTSDQIDTFLKTHEVWIDYSVEDMEHERASRHRDTTPIRYLGPSPASES